MTGVGLAYPYEVLPVLFRVGSADSQLWYGVILRENARFAEDSLQISLSTSGQFTAPFPHPQAQPLEDARVRMKSKCGHADMPINGAFNTVVELSGLLVLNA